MSQYALGYGGGIVSGDQVSLKCSVGEDCSAVLTTQGSTKVYRRRGHALASTSCISDRCASKRTTCDLAEESPDSEEPGANMTEQILRQGGGQLHAGRQPAGGGISDNRSRGSKGDHCSQTLECWVAAHALLALVPDPVTCYKDADYKQQQCFHLEVGSSIVIVDWLTSGRMSRGEGWAFCRMESRNEVLVQVPPLASGGKCSWEAVVIDPLVLEDLPGLTVRERMHGMQVVGMVILLGPRLEKLTSDLLAREGDKRAHFASKAVSNNSNRGEEGHSSGPARRSEEVLRIISSGSIVLLAQYCTTMVISSSWPRRRGVESSPQQALSRQVDEFIPEPLRTSRVLVEKGGHGAEVQFGALLQNKLKTHTKPFITFLDPWRLNWGVAGRIWVMVVWMTRGCDCALILIGCVCSKPQIRDLQQVICS
ncbi:unnamed protein product [Choristocarpus tenellus]